MKFLLVTLLAAAASASFAPLYTAKERIDGSYIVVLKDEVNLQMAISTIKNAPFFTTLGGRIDRVYGAALNGFAASLNERTLEMVRKFDFVKYVEEDQIMRASAVASWGLDRIDQRDRPMDDSYSPTYTGSGVSVYVIDTGINPTHVDFGGRATAASDHVALNPNGVSYGIDCHGHGTHCAGTVGGTSYGVAKSVDLYGVRVLGCLGSGSSSGVIAGMDWVADNHVAPAVASMSLGGGASQADDDAVARLDTAGVTTVVAAGNDNDNACNYSPARAEKAYCVGATGQLDGRASYSNYGTCVEIFAPGTSITSAWYDSDTSSKTISGTSMATPHVAGE
ncbi:hypothetical protein HOLleu_04024 [Holothuria leucospilota]|uniref:Uncharacterized protein n=1 Tax=Holothuria leucospilota TaxID=206669 RepID=A0A9Q1CRH6_HOLLE|nr:hypothetical protein HOLleu_04024 [Holothuria leucospilota]